ncbi:hypothetical protein KPATCC21470_8703 [Kitasatospora purpeofusca]
MTVEPAAARRRLGVAGRDRGCLVGAGLVVRCGPRLMSERGRRGRGPRAAGGSVPDRGGCVAAAPVRPSAPGRSGGQRLEPGRAGRALRTRPPARPHPGRFPVLPAKLFPFSFPDG